MRCDECNSREAQYTIAIVAGSETSTRHLCEVCMEKLREKGEQVGFAEMIHQAVHAIVFHGAEEGKDSPEAELPAISCPACSTTLQSVMRTGKVGCAKCYQTFREPLLMKLKATRKAVSPADVLVAQTTPPPMPPAAEQARQEELTSQLKAAIEAEDYELAAKLRDQLFGKEGGEA